MRTSNSGQTQSRPRSDSVSRQGQDHFREGHQCVWLPLRVDAAQHAGRAQNGLAFAEPLRKLTR